MARYTCYLSRRGAILVKTERSLLLVPSVDVRWRVCGLDGREGLKNAGCVAYIFGDNPGVARFKHHLLSLEMQLGATFDHVANRLIVALRRCYRFAGLLIFPQAYGDVDA